MAQAVADRGRLVAHHACLRVREGVGGGAALKESVDLQGLADMLAQLAAALDWHGALSMDLIVADRGPVIIDINPRLVEPANALAAGVGLVAAMLDVASDAPAQERSSGTAGMRMRQTLLAFSGPPNVTVREVLLFARRSTPFLLGAIYAGSVEELTPVGGDPVAAVPVVAALVATAIHPPLWRKFHAGAVGPYAVTPEAWDEILVAAE
jgi:hypothetical protein